MFAWVPREPFEFAFVSLEAPRELSLIPFWGGAGSSTATGLAASGEDDVRRARDRVGG